MGTVSRWCGTPINTPHFLVRCFNQNKAGTLCTDFTRWCGTPVNTPPSGLVFKSKDSRYGVDCFTLVWYSSKYSSVWYSSKYSPLLGWCSNKNRKEGTMWIVHIGEALQYILLRVVLQSILPISGAVFQSKQTRYSVDCVTLVWYSSEYTPPFGATIQSNNSASSGVCDGSTLV